MDAAPPRSSSVEPIDAFRAKKGEYEERAAELRAVTVGLDTTFHHVMCA